MALLLFAPLTFLVRRDGPLLQSLERLDAFAGDDERLFGGLELDAAILGVGLGPHQLATQGTNPIPMPDHVGDRSAGGVERRGARRAGVEGRLRVGERLRGAVGNHARFGHRALRGVFFAPAQVERGLRAEDEGGHVECSSARAARSVTAPTAGATDPPSPPGRAVRGYGAAPARRPPA